MKISKIRVQNYKLLRDVCFEINPDMNVFVGENDAGKSTLLEVISIISSGKLNGYAFNKQIKDNMFNNHARNEYIDSLTEVPSPPPKIVMKPASWNEWFITKRPIRVEPVRSKLMAATVVG